jgi:uncharacterized protein YjbI with pentapeptide repeats
MNWFGVLQSVISGLVVGLVVYWLDERRAKRDRQLADFRIASNWKNTEPKVTLRDFDLSKRNLSGCKFAKANMENVILFKAILLGANFEGTNLRNADFRKSRMLGTKLAGAIAVSANFSKATITKKIDPENNFWSDFSSISLKGAKFVGTRLKGIRFANASLRGANFRGAIISDCDFSGADLNDVNWKRAKRIENCIWKGIKFAKVENFPPDVWKEIQAQNAE